MQDTKGQPRRFAPPWDVEDNGACLIVRDRGGQALSYAYYENDPGRRTAAQLLTRDEALPASHHFGWNSD